MKAIDCTENGCAKRIMQKIYVMENSESYILRQVVSVIRGRMELLNRNPKLDGLERLGAYREFCQLADDLEATADNISRNN